MTTSEYYIGVYSKDGVIYLRGPVLPQDLGPIVGYEVGEKKNSAVVTQAGNIGEAILKVLASGAENQSNHSSK